jgi:uncharacterized repeat protein (TIGR01451 family)
MKTINEQFTPVTPMLKASQILKTCMRKTFLTMGVGLAWFTASTFSGHAAGLAAVKLHGHVPAIVSHLQAKGNVAADTRLGLAIGLPLRNREALTNLLAQIYDPASTNYQHYLTPEEFTAQFGPTEQDYEMVVNFARVNGLKVTGTHPNRMLLDVSGLAADIQKAFGVALRTYHHPTENRDFFAPDTEPSVPAGLSIQDVSGLDNFRQPHSHYKLKPVSKSMPAAKPSASPSPGATTGSGPAGNYIGDDFRNAYVPGTALNGFGQTVALVQFDGYLSNDIVSYATLAGRTNVPPLQNVLIDGFSGLPTGNGGEVEVSLDIEMSLSMAPALTKIMVYEGDPYNFNPNDVLNRIATDNSAHQVSCSWGWTGGPSASTDQIFQQMALQGQSFFASSGDGDAYPAGTVDDPFNFGTPADSPYITSVGGTTLTMNGAGASYSSETVWNWDITYGPAADGIGSSGGFSSYYPIPSWQTNINMAARGGSTTYRNFPDVALTADDVLVIADGGVEYVGVGGTSCASPLWAGFLSLVNQQAASSGHAAMGFLNPAVYNIANSPAYLNCFHDTTTGNNEWSGSPNLFSAVPGYDLCTGLGAPTGTNLINALTGGGFTNSVIHLSPPPAPYGSTLSVLNGGNPNGTWQLFVLDDAVLNTGIISNGWILNLTTANPVGASADLSLTMTPSASAIIVSNNLSYTLTVTNYGPSISTNVLVSDTLPLSVTLLSSQADQGTVTRNGSLLNWNVGVLGVGAGSRLVFTVRPYGSGNLLNYALASATTPDGNPADDFASTNILATIPMPPQVTGIVGNPDGSIQFSIISAAGQINVVEASTNLANPAGWVPIYTNVGSFLFSDSSATNYPNRFYRDLQISP